MILRVIDVDIVKDRSVYTTDEVTKIEEGKKPAIYAAEPNGIHIPRICRQAEGVLTSAGATWMSTVFKMTDINLALRILINL